MAVRPRHGSGDRVLSPALHDLSAVQQAAAIRAGDISPVELVEHYLDRIAAHSEDVGAFVTVIADAAREAAHHRQDHVARARQSDASASLPPLCGVPIAVKDVVAVAGVPMRMGTVALDPVRFDVDDHVVARLRAAGAVVVGTTNTPEFALAAYTEPDGLPPARTPWDTSLSAGGSSGGSAAAVATGLVPCAHGTDGGGSVRTPASACGVVGLKTSRGRISPGPRHGEGPGLGVHGFLTRTVRDAALLLDATSGPMSGDVSWAPRPTEPFAVAAARAPGRLRIGRYREPLLADVVLHPEVRAAYDAATELLTACGHEVVEAPAPFSREIVPAFETIWSVGAASIPVPPEREAMLTPLVQWLRDRGAAVSGAAYATALGSVQAAARCAVVAAAGYNAVLLPTLAAPPVPVGAMRDDADPAGDFAAQERFNPFSAAYNMTGQPAITLPLYWTAAGLPIGVQLVGRPADESTLLALAGQLEEAQPWADRKPPVWTSD